MQPIGYADHVKVYHIEHDINDIIYYRFCNGKLRRSAIQFDQDGEAYFMIQNTLKYYMHEVMKINWR